MAVRHGRDERLLGIHPTAADCGAETMCGESEPGTVSPPPKCHVCPTKYRRFRKSGPMRLQRRVAVCSDAVQFAALNCLRIFTTGNVSSSDIGTS